MLELGILIGLCIAGGLFYAYLRYVAPRMK